MSFTWLQNSMPRGLYGRAALILIVPVVFVQLVVSIAFIQRHFEDVTTQMTQTLLQELDLVWEAVDGAQTQDEALARMQPFTPVLRIDVRFEDPPDNNVLRWYDFSGRVMIRTVEARVPEINRFVLPDNDIAVFYADTYLGPVRIEVDRDRVSAANPHQLLVTMVFFGALMTVISYIYLRNQLRPITRLARAATAFGRGRHVPYTPRGAIEVRAAGAAFVDMRARIERQIEQRTLMLSGVSHDLRTPLTRLKLGLSMMDEEEAEPLLRDVDEMQRLLDEFLNFAKGASEGEPEEVDPQEIVQAAVEDAKRAGNDVRLTSVEGQGHAMLRPVPVRRALDNLIGNAVRYGTRAEVSMAITDKSLRFRVEDDGPGIPEEKRAEALKPFARLDPARNQNKGSGVGLGLAIASDTARAHGGTLRLGTSESLGGLQADIVIGL